MTSWLRLTTQPKFILGTALILTLVTLPYTLQTGFNSNILDLQDPDLESVRYEKIIQDKSDLSTWFLATSTQDLETLSRLKTKIESLKTVKKTESILDILPLSQIERLQAVQNLNLLQIKNTTNPNTTYEALSQFKKHISSLATASFSSGMIEEFEELQSLADQLQNYELIILKQKTAPHEIEFLDELKRAQKFLKNLLTPQKLTQADLPQDLLNIYKSKKGSYSLTIYPHQNIWDAQHMQDFIKDVRQVIPDVTGAPVTSYESAERMIAGFILVALLTSVIVFTLLLLQFKAIKEPLYIYLNLVMTLCWLGAFMKFMDIQINLANFFALPVLIGSGIDHGLHIFHAYREKQDLQALFKTTVPAITASCLTTICGFGSLAFVHHRGLASFGLIMAVGTFLILLTSILILPNIIALIPRHKVVSTTCANDL